jgi:hypothetical protein
MTKHKILSVTAADCELQTLGQDAAREAEDARREATPTIMADEMKFEVRVGGHWTQVSETDLRA